MKKILHIIEFLLLKLMLLIFSAMSFSAASNIGGFLGRKIGPKLSVNTTARNNLRRAMPELSETRVEEILLGMWDNLGRVVTEFSQIKVMSHARIAGLISVEGQENLDALLRSSGNLLVSGHLGNWEMMPATPYRLGHPLHVVYRRANNPYVDKIISKMREPYHASASAKGPVGARQIIKAIRQGLQVIMLVDQKQNDGIAVPFFGIPAMTAPAIANLALKYDCQVFPVRIVRQQHCHFKFVTYPPIIISKSGDEKQDIFNLMQQINQILEGWIRETPEQWFWVHNRWPKV